MCSSERGMSDMPRMPWGWGNLGLIFIFGWTIPLNFILLFVLWSVYSTAQQ